MNAQPKYIRFEQRVCRICAAVFSYRVTKGAPPTRCPTHRIMGHRQVRRLMLVPPPPEPVIVTGIAIIRACIGCGDRFVARDERALYCDLNCFARFNCHRLGIGQP